MTEQKFHLTLHYADCCGRAGNCAYPHTVTAHTTGELQKYLGYDHVFIHFQENVRAKDNFVSAAAVVFDCDNDHTEDAAAWITPEDIPGLFWDIRCFTATSRHHMKPKGKRTARPRFHVIFPVVPITTPATYTEFMKKVQSHYSFFDGNALDAARFFFGNPDTEVVYHPGAISLTEHIAELEGEDSFSRFGTVIPEGSRNSAMSRIGGRIIKRYGDTDEAKTRFLEAAEQCEPPLDDDELEQIWGSARRFYSKIKEQPGYIAPQDYETVQHQWETPIPFEQPSLPTFPVEVFPPAVRNFVSAVAESTQTPVDMAACAALAILALCIQGKYKIRGKSDWTEPLNLFVVIVAEPSERKSAIINFMTKPVKEYEAGVNKANAPRLESNKMRKRVLERKQKSIEEMVAKGKAPMDALDTMARELSDFKEETPLRLYVDDVTTEKLTSVLAENDGKAAIVSAEGGLFDMLSGLYSKNVNIDVMLKGYSGDSIRVDRIGRNSESIMNPALTVLLAVQPSVLSGLMQNGNFRGRGLTARFLYCLPTSIVGNRKYRTEPIPDAVALEYDKLIRNLLEDPGGDDITLSAEADALLEAFSNEVEGKLKQEYAEIQDWAGKLVGTVLRIAGVLCRAGVYRYDEFLDDPAPLVVGGEMMANAIAVGRYFTAHAQAAFTMMGANALVKNCQYILGAIEKNALEEFNRRDIMRLCRSIKTTGELQPILDHLVDYGYLAPKPEPIQVNKGRSASQSYLVNPCIIKRAS